MSNLGGWTRRDARGAILVSSGLPSSGIPDATTASKGIVQLAGDLSGTAAAPVVANNAITSAKIADGTIVDADISAVGGITGAKIATGTLRALHMRLLAACGWWYYASPPADYSNRYFSYAASSYYDNGVALTGSAQVGADGIMYCRQTGTYLMTVGAINNHGAVAGNYAGGRLVLNGVTRYILAGAHTAATADTDTQAGGHGSGSIILNLNNGDYMRVEAWSSAGYPIYLTLTWLQLPI